MVSNLWFLAYQLSSLENDATLSQRKLSPACSRAYAHQLPRQPEIWREHVGRGATRQHCRSGGSGLRTTGRLEALELPLAGRGETHHNGMPFRLPPPLAEQNIGKTTLVPCSGCESRPSARLRLQATCRSLPQSLSTTAALLMTRYYTKSRRNISETSYSVRASGSRRTKVQHLELPARRRERQPQLRAWN
jgi:hypothetical protein